MFVSEDGVPYGSIDVSKLDEIDPKTDEAKAQLDALKTQAQAGQELADADADRVAEQAAAQAAQLEPEQAAAQPDELQDGGELEALRAEAEALGVKVDKRWGADRLRAEIDAAARVG
jgi:hypothetical protein